MVAPEVGFRSRPVWFAALIALVVGQGALALQLFGGGLNDDRPILEFTAPRSIASDRSTEIATLLRAAARGTLAGNQEKTP